jgi:hypothetical protein
MAAYDRLPVRDDAAAGPEGSYPHLMDKRI